ncbi:MAG: hypothetical protein K9L60_02305 [Methylovulum sp.]|nr:hypothetical protein [Methylovulum sp.]MCF7997955.1 hypothetical protein [Methylovulum sp.]
MINSKVIRRPYHHITRADYHDAKPLLGSENVKFPKIPSLQARFLTVVLSGQTLSHRGFDFLAHSYRSSSFVGELRDKGWPLVNHDKIALTGDFVPRTATFTDYELFATFTPELKIRVDAFQKSVNDFLKNTKEVALMINKPSH